MVDENSTYDGDSVEFARSLCQQAAELHEQADYAAARARYERALAIQQRVCGEMHPDTARCLHGLGQVLMKQGDDAQARSLLEQALAIQEQVLGPAHPDTAGSLHTIAELRSNRGDYETGSALMQQAFALRERALGADHPDTLESMTLLATMLAVRGDRAEAERLLTRALSICERALGEHHRTTARALNGLGRFWAANEATYARARPLYERALAIYERLLGPDHPFTALVLNNLAALLADMQDFQAALPLLERSLAAHEQVYGMESWQVSFVLINLADVHRKLGDHAVARPLLERALIVRERAWGGQHPETARCLRKLVAVLGVLHQKGDEGAMVVAMPLHQCLMAFETAAGTLDPALEQMPGTRLDPAKAAQRLHELVAKLEDGLARPPLSPDDQASLQTARDLGQQADEQYDQGDYAAAQSLLEEALALQERVLGENHLAHVELLKKLADARERQGQYSAVLPLLQRVVDIHLQVLGAEHPMTGIALSALTSRYAYEYGPAASLLLQKRALHSMVEALGPDDAFVALAQESIQQMQATLAEITTDVEPVGLSRSEKREQALATLSPEKQTLLAGLEQIPWHDLHHAYGPADDVPNLLRLLLSDDKNVRDGAWEELYGNIWHQGDVYQATSYAIPFLIRMLDSDAVPDKHSLLAFLEAIATGHPWLSKRQTWMKSVLAEQGRDFQAEIDLARLYTDRAREAVAEGLDTYLACLHHPAPIVQEAASALLDALPGHAAHIRP